MAEGVFRFKQFTIEQDRCTMKVGTDALLFGAWVDHAGARRILDIGTGTGVLALIAAQRNSGARIDAVEIDGDAAEQAKANAAASPWGDRIAVHNMDARRLRVSDPFDLIISNPPYYDGQAASASAQARVAKHGADLALAELFDCAARLLGDEGRFCIIAPSNREPEMLRLAHHLGLHLSRRCSLRYVAHRPAKRLMLQFSRLEGDVFEEEITVEGDGPKSFTPEARRLVSDLVDR